MAGSTIVLVATVSVVVLAALFVFTTSARRDRAAAVDGMREAEATDRGDEAAEAPVSGRELERAVALERHGGGRAVVGAPTAAPPAPRAPMDPEALAVTRRQFFNRSITAFFTLGLAGFGAASLGFLWPTLTSGFGAKVRAGKVDEITDQIAANREPYYVASARSWIATYPKDAVGKAEKEYTGAVLEGMKAGFVALYQKCPHLGCRVPFCQGSQWFECPCHGSQYNRAGEKKGGPAPRGMDRFGLSVEGGVVVVDTSEVIQGPPIGVNTTGQEAEGPHCV